MPLPHQPNQLILNNSTLYVSFPAVPQIAAINIDTLSVTAQNSLTGGPVLDLAFDSRRNRLYALNVLAPHHHGLTIFEGSTLTRIALVAGAGDFSMQMGAVLASTPSGNVLVSERNRLWQIAPDNFADTFADAFAITQIYPTGSLAPAGGLQVDKNTGAIYILDTQAKLLRIYP